MGVAACRPKALAVFGLIKHTDVQRAGAFTTLCVRLGASTSLDLSTGHLTAGPLCEHVFIQAEILADLMRFNS